MSDYYIEAATKEEWAARALAAEERLAKAVDGLNSIAANTCCGKCQEAALVAKTTLAELTGNNGEG